MSVTLANCRDLGLKHRWMIGYRRSQDGSYLMWCKHCRCEAIWRPWPALDGGQE